MEALRRLLPYHDQTIHLEICVTVQSELCRPQSRRTLLCLAPERNRHADDDVVFRRLRASLGRLVAPFPSTPPPDPRTESGEAVRSPEVLSPYLSSYRSGHDSDFGPWRETHRIGS